MKRVLHMESAVTAGYNVRDILDVFPEIEDNFRERKEFDEYYFEPVIVELTIEKLNQLNQYDFEVKINQVDITITS